MIDQFFIKKTLIKKHALFILLFASLFIVTYFQITLMKGTEGVRWLFWNFIFSLLTAYILYVFTYKKWIAVLFVYTFAFLAYANLLYFRNFGTFMPIETLNLVSNLNDLFPSIQFLIRFKDISFMIILILFASVLPYVNLDKSFSSRLVLGKWIIPTLGTMLAIEYTVYWHNNGKIKDIINNYYYFDTAKAIKPFGMYGFYLWNISQLISNTQYDYKELNQVEAFLKSLHSSCNRIESENKNVIVLIVESLETWPIFAKYGNTEVAPNLNKIIKQGMFFPLVKTQVKGGMSSDCQLIINTGLLPINEGAVFFKYAHNKFLTLADALKLNKKIYSSAVIIGDEPTYWNQKIMTYRLGYDCFFSSSELDNNDIVGMGISDSSVLAQSVNIIKSMKQPFLVQIITLSSHMPFKIPIEKIKIVLPDSIDTQTRNYLEAINYTDYCIGLFIEDLKKIGIYDRTMLFITGDHYSNVSTPDFIKIKSFVPLIMVNAPIKGVYNACIGQVDIFPTLLDLLGLEYKWRGIGTSKVCENFNFYSNNEEIYENLITSCYDDKKLFQISDVIIRSNWFELDKKLNYE